MDKVSRDQLKGGSGYGNTTDSNSTKYHVIFKGVASLESRGGNIFDNRDNNPTRGLEGAGSSAKCMTSIFHFFLATHIPTSRAVTRNICDRGKELKLRPNLGTVLAM